MVVISLQCALVGAAGSAFPVDIDTNVSVGHLKDAIAVKQKYEFAASKLRLFLAKKDGAWLESATNDVKMLKKGVATAVIEALMGEDKELQGEDDLLDVLNGMPPPVTKQIHVLVVVPEVESKRPADVELVKILKKLKTIEPKTLTDFTSLSVNEDEFQLNSLCTKQESDCPIVRTPGLHEFWKGLGEFPPYYFVRTEEVVFWGLMKKLMLTIDKDRVVIVGSPGVGKSCFLMLTAFYLACIQKKKVLVIRRLKESEIANAVVFFDGQGSFARLTNLSPNDLFAIRTQAKGATVLVDGFKQTEVDDHKSGLLPFHFLATSCQFDAKQDDNSHVVVLPAWRDDDLLQYANLTDWVIEAGFRKTKRLKASTWPKLVKEQYFYSGGSLREFCRTREKLKTRVVDDCAAVKGIQAFQLVYSYGDAKTDNQVDRIRRHYITDCSNEEHYHKRTWWKLSVDSGYALSKLGRIVDTEKQLEIYKYAKSIGAGFHGIAYELLLHNAVQGAFAKRKPVVLKMREGSTYEKIEIRVPHVICNGEDEATCYSFLSTLGRDTYWHPSYPFFPFIDAVATCEAFPSGSEESETIVAYIQVTIRSEKTFKTERLRRLNDEMDKNQSLRDMKRAFVVVGPDSGVCERFELHDAPDPNSFLAMVSCFDPKQLEPKQAEM